MGDGITRRAAIGAASMLGVAAAACAGGTFALAEEADAQAADLADMTREEVVAFLEAQTEVTQDLVLDDGTVIPAVYVAVRNRINRIGGGLGSEVDPSYNYWMFVTSIFSEEEAEAYLQMPITKNFTATEMADKSGFDEEYCLELCESFAGRGILYRMRRGGVAYFRVNPQINGIWEYSINLWDGAHNDGVYDIDYLDRHWGQYSNPGWAIGVADSDSAPWFRSVPVNREVLGEDFAMSAYDDFEAILRTRGTVALGDCVCRSELRGRGVSCEHEDLVETEILTGEMAEYYIENGNAREVTPEEAIEVIRNAVDRGCVVQTTNSKAGEIFCCCGGDSCKMLNGVKNLGGLEGLSYYSHFDLAWDGEACVGCGTCAQRCPMETIEMTDGKPVTGLTCVRCGQCAIVCPMSARKLVPTQTEQPELPDDMFENDLGKAVTRARRGYIADYVPGI